MIKDKLRALMGARSELDIQNERERLELIQEMQKQAKAITQLVKTDGWKMIEDYLNKRKTQLHIQLETCSDKDLIRIQSEIKATTSVFGFLNSVIMQNVDT